MSQKQKERAKENCPCSPAETKENNANDTMTSLNDQKESFKNKSHDSQVKDKDGSTVTMSQKDYQTENCPCNVSCLGDESSVEATSMNQRDNKGENSPCYVTCINDANATQSSSSPNSHLQSQNEGSINVCVKINAGQRGSDEIVNKNFSKDGGKGPLDLTVYGRRDEEESVVCVKSEVCDNQGLVVKQLLTPMTEQEAAAEENAGNVEDEDDISENVSTFDVSTLSSPDLLSEDMSISAPDACLNKIVQVKGNTCFTLSYSPDEPCLPNTEMTESSSSSDWADVRELEEALSSQTFDTQDIQYMENRSPQYTVASISTESTTQETVMSQGDTPNASVKNENNEEGCWVLEDLPKESLDAKDDIESDKEKKTLDANVLQPQLAIEYKTASNKETSSTPILHIDVPLDRLCEGHLEQDEKKEDTYNQIKESQCFYNEQEVPVRKEEIHQESYDFNEFMAVEKSSSEKDKKSREKSTDKLSEQLFPKLHSMGPKMGEKSNGYRRLQTIKPVIFATTNESLEGCKKHLHYCTETDCDRSKILFISTNHRKRNSEEAFSSQSLEGDGDGDGTSGEQSKNSQTESLFDKLNRGRKQHS